MNVEQSAHLFPLGFIVEETIPSQTRLHQWLDNFKDVNPSLSTIILVRMHVGASQLIYQYVGKNGAFKISWPRCH